MRRNTFLIITFFVMTFCLLIGAGTITSFISYAEDEDCTIMYRMYNPNSGEHFYTGSVEERLTLSYAGWNYEGIAWHAPKSGNPVYRLYNANAGDHHYTTSEKERDNLIDAGWAYEGIAWRYDPDGAPLYRLYNPNAISGSHHYTMSEKEKDSLVNLGWSAEGIGWCANSKCNCREKYYYDESDQILLVSVRKDFGPGVREPGYNDNLALPIDEYYIVEYLSTQPVEKIWKYVDACIDDPNLVWYLTDYLPYIKKEEVMNYVRDHASEIESAGMSGRTDYTGDKHVGDSDGGYVCIRVIPEDNGNWTYAYMKDYIAERQSLLEATDKAERFEKCPHIHWHAQRINNLGYVNYTIKCDDCDEDVNYVLGLWDVREENGEKTVYVRGGYYDDNDVFHWTGLSDKDWSWHKWRGDQSVFPIDKFIGDYCSYADYDGDIE